jgi:hypothetical protein
MSGPAASGLSITLDRFSLDADHVEPVEPVERRRLDHHLAPERNDTVAMGSDDDATAARGPRRLYPPSDRRLCAVDSGGRARRDSSQLRTTERTSRWGCLAMWSATRSGRRED